MRYELWRKSEINGCTYEDGSDTRKYSSELIIVQEDESESFQESIADDYGSQDYSYQVDYNKLCTLSEHEFEQLKDRYL